MKRKPKVTMNDIARAAGVSQATVSLVLNQSRNIKLSDDTRQRVINVATELGYDRLPAVHAPRNQEEIALLVSSMQSFDPFIDAISQAREFCKAADATGIILTKLDGTAKGGCVVAVKQRLGLPVRFIGVGEGIDDLLPFTPEGFVEELLPREWKH